MQESVPRLVVHPFRSSHHRPKSVYSQRLSKEDYALVEELRAQNAIAQCEESESHFKYGFSAGLIVQQEAHEQLQNKK